MKHLEDELHKQIAQYLFYTIKSKNDFWTYMPFGEKRNIITGALLKAKGTKKGVPDFLILKRQKTTTKIIWLEVKTGKNKQTQEQIDFENKISGMYNEDYYVIHSIQELKEVLKKYE